MPAVHFVEDHGRHASRPRAATSIARLIRASSPPEATLRSGRGGCPGLAETRNSQRSAPKRGRLAASSIGGSSMANTPPAMPSSPIRRADRRSPACRRRAGARLDSRGGGVAPVRPRRHPASRTRRRLRSPRPRRPFEFVAQRIAAGARQLLASARGACGPDRAGGPVGCPAAPAGPGRGRGRRAGARAGWRPRPAGSRRDSNRAATSPRRGFALDVAGQLAGQLAQASRDRR